MPASSLRSGPIGTSLRWNRSWGSTPRLRGGRWTVNIRKAGCPSRRLLVEQALRAYTFGSAYASFDERSKATIEPGKLADIAVLSDDILAIDPSRIDKVKVAITVFDGKIVYERR